MTFIEKLSKQKIILTMIPIDNNLSFVYHNPQAIIIEGFLSEADKRLKKCWLKKLMQKEFRTETILP